MATTKSTCPYCGVGCGVLIESDGAQITRVTGDPDHPANFGRLCTKGSTLHLTAIPDGRALYPEMRHDRDVPRQRESWSTTLSFLAQHFADCIRTHGPDSVGFYISGQLLTEDYYVFNKLAKGLIGTNNVDTNSRLCMSSAVSGYKLTLGADAPPACYEDIDHADLIFIAGSNTAFAHPILFRRIEAAKAKRPDIKIIVVDPRRTDTAAFADLHLPILPGTDVALFNGLLHLLLWDNRVDPHYIADHTEGFDALKQTVRDYHPKLVAETCGIAETDLVLAAKWFGELPAVLSLYCQGLNQSSHGTEKNAALINLHLATGKIGKPGAGPFSLTGQPNAMGGREVGGMANLLSAHRDLANAEHRAEVAALWGVPDVPSKPGRTAVEMFDAVASGEIKMLWIACTNPAQSMPDQAKIRNALVKAELVVLQEAYTDTETAAYADVLLPAATWGEKEGTVTNSERRITRLNAAIAAPGEARADWRIVVDFARKLETLLRPDSATLFPYENTESIFNEHRESTRGRDLDISGLSYEILEIRGPQQWPFVMGASEGRMRLYADGKFPTPSGKAKFFNSTYKAVAEKANAQYPLRLNTGRMRDQWHGMSRTGKVARLFDHVSEPMLSMAKVDMAKRGLHTGTLVRVRSRRGEAVIPVSASEELRPGQVFLPMHWGSRFMAGLGINAMTLPAFDPYSKQPELKHAAVQVEKLDLPWHFVAMAIGEPDEAATALTRLAKLRDHLSAFEYASVGLFGQSQESVIFRAAASVPLSASFVAQIDRILGMTGTDDVLHYDDRRRDIGRKIRVKNGKLAALRLSGDASAKDWLQDWLAQGTTVSHLTRVLLTPSAKPPQNFKPRGRVICNCLNIAESEIVTQLKSISDRSVNKLGALQSTLKCGTECGSCLPELRRMVQMETLEAA
jgi:assimilatory nitrate reductase catalytic subunit